jgi:hypothetical protein
MKKRKCPIFVLGMDFRFTCVCNQRVVGLHCSGKSRCSNVVPSTS